MKPDLTVKRYYEALEEGTILGRQCTDCGNVEWPPVYSCNACGGHHTEWTHLSGEAVVEEFVVAKGLLVQLKELMPYAVGHVRLKEGPVVSQIIQGISLDNADELRARLPLPVRSRIIAMPEGYSRVVFELAD